MGVALGVTVAVGRGVALGAGVSCAARVAGAVTDGLAGTRAGMHAARHTQKNRATALAGRLRCDVFMWCSASLIVAL